VLSGGNNHRDYQANKPLRYKFYRYVCGRDKRLEQLRAHAGTAH